MGTNFHNERELVIDVRGGKLTGATKPIEFLNLKGATDYPCGILNLGDNDNETTILYSGEPFLEPITGGDLGECNRKYHVAREWGAV